MVKGEDDLVWDTPTNRGKRVKFTYLKKIKSDDELREYLPLSGYSTIEEWRKDSKNYKHLFMLKLVGFIKKVKW